MAKDFYTTLGVPRTASDDEIKKYSKDYYSSLRSLQFDLIKYPIENNEIPHDGDDFILFTRRISILIGEF